MISFAELRTKLPLKSTDWPVWRVITPELAAALLELTDVEPDAAPSAEANSMLPLSYRDVPLVKVTPPLAVSARPLSACAAPDFPAAPDEVLTDPD
jgi:hypothetical protein